MTFTGVNGLVRRLEGLGVLTESTGHRRHRVFVYADYLRLFTDAAD